MRPPYTAPLVRSLASPGISPMLPARSGPFERPAEHFATSDNVNDLGNPFSGANQTPGVGAFPGPYGSDYGPPVPAAEIEVLHRAPQPRPAWGSAYFTPPSLWNLSGISTGWSRPFAPTLGRQPTIKLALGKWTPSAHGHAPLPTLPEPARMVAPRF